MKIHYLQHVPFEGLASIEHWAKSKGHALSSTQQNRGNPHPLAQVSVKLTTMVGGEGQRDASVPAASKPLVHTSREC